VPDWLFKTFLVFSVWVLTLTGLGLVISGVLDGCVEARGSRTYCSSSSPISYALQIGVLLFGTVCASLLAILSLGFIPSVGKAYKALYRRRLGQQEAEQSRDEAGAEFR